MRRNRVLTAWIAAAVLTGSGLTVAVARSGHGDADRASDGARPGGNAGRFLDLTGDSAADAAAARSLAASGTAAAGDPDDAQDAKPGAPEGQYTPQGWKLTPAGTQAKVFNFPLGLLPTPDGKNVVVTSDNGGMQGLAVLDAADPSSTPGYMPAANLFMGLAVTGGGKLYASGGNANRVFRYQLAGPLAVSEDPTQQLLFPNHNARDGIAEQATGGAWDGLLPVGDGVRVNGYPGASVLDGRYLYVAGTLSEPSGRAGTADACPSGQPVCGRVSVIDTTNDTVVRRIPVGRDAFGLALDSARHRLYVSNWADEAGRGHMKGGTVSVVDITDPAKATEVGSTQVGHHPSAVQLSKDRTRLFVANTNDDTISVVDVSGSGATTIKTESVKPASGIPVGAHPDAFALSPDGQTLFVALAGLNAVEVRDGRTAAPLSGGARYIPTGWYPSALTVTPTKPDGSAYRLWVANAKGGGAAGAGLNLSVGERGDPLTGTVSVIDLPAPAKEARWNEQVVENDHLTAGGVVDSCTPQQGVTEAMISQVLCPPKGEKSPVKHVVYIVTENKTFDQYFGDLDASKWDADPTYLLYGDTVTPNHHALATRFSLGDRFFSDAQVSVTGHSWTSGAIATDHNERTWPADYDQGLRGTHGNSDALRPSVAGEQGKEIQQGEDELEDPEGGYIFEAFKRAGAQAPAANGTPVPLSMAIYGEHTAREADGMEPYKAPGWKDGDIQYFDTCRAMLFVTGKAPDGPVPNDAPDQFADCKGRTLPKQFTLDYWTSVWKANPGHDVMPNFIYMSLPVNHTLGTNLGSPTPMSMVADNDYAIGLITQALSKSPFWESTVVMQTEDDTQAAGDHISPLRDYLSVSGPWASPTANHQWGSMPSLLRTIETLFGVEPIALTDKLAMPQHGAFRKSLKEKPDTRPYTAIKPLVPYALNEPGAVGQAESMTMNWSTYDLIDEQLLNAILYADARHTPLRLP